jgi:hypothetical protein
VTADAIVVLVTSRYARPRALEATLVELAVCHQPIRVVVPLVLPLALPTDAYPPRSAQQIEALRETAVRTLARYCVDGDARIVRGEDIVDVLKRGTDGLEVATVVLVGAASWALRRAAAAIAPIIQPGRKTCESGTISAA